MSAAGHADKAIKSTGTIYEKPLINTLFQSDNTFICNSISHCPRRQRNGHHTLSKLMFMFVDVGSGLCISAYALFVSKVGVAMAQFLHELEIVGCDGCTVLLTGDDSHIQCHGSL
jgi:hypothetical protein